MVYMDNGVLPVKLYNKDLRICSFTEQWEPYEYTEKEASEELKEAIVQYASENKGSYNMFSGKQNK